MKTIIRTFQMDEYGTSFATITTKRGGKSTYRHQFSGMGFAKYSEAEKFLLTKSNYVKHVKTEEVYSTTCREILKDESL